MKKRGKKEKKKKKDLDDIEDVAKDLKDATVEQGRKDKQQSKVSGVCVRVCMHADTSDDLFIFEALHLLYLVIFYLSV
jgi:hypothetical protein